MGVYKFSDASSLATDKISYKSMLAGNTTWVDWKPNGAYESLSTITVPSGGVASITFAVIPNTYRHLEIRAVGRTTAAAADHYASLIFNNDTATNYSYKDLRGDGSGTPAWTALANQPAIYLQRYAGGSSSASLFGATVTTILDYANLNKNKTLKSIGGVDKNGSGLIYLVSGSWRNLSSISSITITPEAGSWAEHSQFSLYGVN